MKRGRAGNVARQMRAEEPRPDVVVLPRRGAEHKADLFAFEEFVGRLRECSGSRSDKKHDATVLLKAAIRSADPSKAGTHTRDASDCT